MCLDVSLQGVGWYWPGLPLPSLSTASPCAPHVKSATRSAFPGLCASPSTARGEGGLRAWFLPQNTKETYPGPTLSTYQCPALGGPGLAETPPPHLRSVWAEDSQEGRHMFCKNHRGRRPVCSQESLLSPPPARLSTYSPLVFQKQIKSPPSLRGGTPRPPQQCSCQAPLPPHPGHLATP